MDGKVDPEIFNLIKNVLIKKYSKDDDEADCIVNVFRDNRIIDRIYEPTLLMDEDRLSNELEPFLAEAEETCSRRTDPQPEPEPLPAAESEDPITGGAVVAIVAAFLIVMILIVFLV